MTATNSKSMIVFKIILIYNYLKFEYFQESYNYHEQETNEINNEDKSPSNKNNINNFEEYYGYCDYFLISFSSIINSIDLYSSDISLLKNFKNTNEDDLEDLDDLFCFNKFSKRREERINSYIGIDRDLLKDLNLSSNIEPNHNIIEHNSAQSFKLYTAPLKRSKTSIMRYIKLLRQRRKIKLSLSRLNDLNNNIQMHNKVDNYLKNYYEVNLAYWRYSVFKPLAEKSPEKSQNRTCRICENSFFSKDFVYHIYFCMEEQILLKEFNLNRNILKNIYSSCKDYQIKSSINITNTPELFSRKKSKIQNSKFKNKKSTKEINAHISNFIDVIIKIVKKERNIPYESYENNPNKMLSLYKMSLIFSNLIIKFLNNQDEMFNNIPNKGDVFNDIILKMTVYLLKKESILKKLFSLIKLKENIFMNKTLDNYEENHLFNVDNTSLFDIIVSKNLTQPLTLSKNKSATTGSVTLVPNLTSKN